MVASLIAVKRAEEQKVFVLDFDSRKGSSEIFFFFYTYRYHLLGTTLGTDLGIWQNCEKSLLYYGSFPWAIIGVQNLVSLEPLATMRLEKIGVEIKWREIVLLEKNFTGRLLICLTKERYQSKFTQDKLRGGAIWWNFTKHQTILGWIISRTHNEIKRTREVGNKYLLWNLFLQFVAWLSLFLWIFFMSFILSFFFQWKLSLSLRKRRSKYPL